VSLWRCIDSTEYAHLKNTSRHWRVVVKQSQTKYVKSKFGVDLVKDFSGYNDDITIGASSIVGNIALA